MQEILLLLIKIIKIKTTLLLLQLLIIMSQCNKNLDLKCLIFFMQNILVYVGVKWWQ